MVFYVISRTYAEMFSLLRVCSGLLSNTPGLIFINAQRATDLIVVTQV